MTDKELINIVTTSKSIDEILNALTVNCLNEAQFNRVFKVVKTIMDNIQKGIDPRFTIEEVVNSIKRKRAQNIRKSSSRN